MPAATMSARSRTVTPAGTVSIRVGTRVAVTTTSVSSA
jgi:hypothetical protein